MWMSSLKRGSSPRLVDAYFAKGAAIMVCHDEVIKDRLAAKVTKMVACESSRLNMVALDALPTYKNVVTWFLGPVEDTGRYFLLLRRLNRDLDTEQCRVC